MKYILHIGHTTKHIKLKPNQEITSIIKNFVAIFYMFTGVTLILQSRGIINILEVTIKTFVFTDLILIWVLIFVFIVKEYNTNITE